MPKKKTYTPMEQLMFYGKRFLKVFVPAVLVLLPAMGLSPESFLVSVAVPALTTFEKWMRDNDWYNL